MPKSSVNASLSSYDDIFSTEESRQEEQREQVQQIPIGELFPFKNHPFKVLDDDSMSDTVESVKQYGVLSPLIARPRPKGGYEIISGHRRQHAAELAGLETLPVIVRQMDDDAAIILMVDSNLQREHILPSERAFAYKMKLDAMKNQGTRSDLTSTQVVSKLRSNEKLGAENNQSRETVRRFIRLTNLIADYMTAETELPAYLPYPRFLLKMDISHTAKLLYALLLDRSTLSQKNGWQDSEGRTYIVYPIAEIAEMLDKGCTTIKGALNELDAAGLLERRRTGFSAANHLYVKVPDIPVVQFSDQLTDGKPPLIRAGNRPTDSRKTDLMTDGKPSPNQTNINNLIESQTKRASEGQSPAAYGRYKNVFLSDAELLELEQDFPGKWEYYLDRLSCHIASTGKQYHSHAATIYKWAQEDAAKGKAAPKQGIPDYSCKEGESL